MLPQSGNGQAGANDVNVQLRIVGPYLYAMSPRSLVAYHLDHPAEEGWSADMGQMLNPNFQALIPTRDFLMVVGEPGGRQLAAANPVPAFQLRFYSRMKIKGSDSGESGKIEQMETISDPTGVVHWQAAEGGIYYLSNNHRLHFVRGSRP